MAPTHAMIRFYLLSKPTVAVGTGGFGHINFAFLISLLQYPFLLIVRVTALVSFSPINVSRRFLSFSHVEQSASPRQKCSSESSYR